MRGPGKAVAGIAGQGVGPQGGEGTDDMEGKERLWSEAYSACADIRKWPHQMVNKDQLTNLCARYTLELTYLHLRMHITLQT